jgi:BlaI family penicillinase repressor
MINKLLTPLELKVMNILWKIKRGFVKDILDCWAELPLPAYNTVSTTVRILQDKGFVGFSSVGRGYEYYPLMSKANYQKNLIVNVLENAFAGSASSLVSALVSDEKISEQEIQEIQEILDHLK